MDEPTTVSELLEKAELQEYCDAFEEEGYDSLSQLRKITENDLADLIKDVQMKKGHVKRLRAALGLPEVSAAGSSAGPAPAAPAPVRCQPRARDCWGWTSCFHPSRRRRERQPRLASSVPGPVALARCLPPT